MPAFNVDGDGLRFMQEPGIDGDAIPVEALFIDTPGANAQRKNSDLLTHRARYGALCLPAAAMALYTLQAFAPAGGAGIRTSMRGGGPLSALVVPQGEEDGPPPLWQTLWANILPGEHPVPPADTVFAWLRSDLPVGREAGGVEIHQGQPPFDSRLHPFFGMPRRIWLQVSGNGACDLTGREGPLVTGFLQKPHGLNYGGWIHPLTPYRRQRQAETPYSVKPKSGRFGYRDWVAVTVGGAGDDETKLSLAARSVALARRERADVLSEKGSRPSARIRLAGWAMSNMEAISYVVAEQPLPLADPADVAFMDDLAREMAEAGDTVNRALRFAIQNALDVKDDKGSVGQARNAFYERTDDAFHEVLAEVVLEIGADSRGEAARRWLDAMRSAALNIFDATCPVPLEDAEAAARVVAARAGLYWTLRGWGKRGKALFEILHLPVPQKRETREEEPA